MRLTPPAPATRRATVAPLHPARDTGRMQGLDGVAADHVAAPAAELTPDTSLGGSPFPPIADYGFLSDNESLALVAPSGNVEWMCLPRVDSPSVFGAMLDRSAGYFRVGPSGISVPASRRY